MCIRCSYNCVPLFILAFPQKRLFHPHHPEKYTGDVSRIVMRSSWETRFALWCDRTPSIVNWSSEETVIPYVNKVDNAVHRYFMDFKIVINTQQGLKTYLIEIKPHAQTQPPTQPKRLTPKRRQILQEQVETYVQNQCKWAAAKVYAEKRGWGFKIITEYELGIK